MALSLAALFQANASDDAVRRKARYYFLEGARRQATNDYENALEFFRKAYLIDPSYVDASKSYGILRLGVQSDSVQSRKGLLTSFQLLRPYIDAYPTDLTEVRAYSFMASRVDSISEAVRVFERYDSLNPGNTVVMLQLSDTYMEAGEPEKALKMLERFEKSEGKSPQLSLKKMGVMLSKGDTLSAVAEANDLITTNPKEPDYYLLKGHLYEVIGSNDSTLSAYLEAERVSPDNGTVKISLADYYKNVGDSVNYDKKVYEALLSEDFILEDKLQLLSEYLQALLDQKNDTSRGDHVFDVLREQYPHEPKVLDLSARYSAAKGNLALAEEEMSYALDQDPSNVEYWGQLMRYQMADDRPAQAMDTYRKSTGHIEDNQALKLMYASAATMAKDYDAAEKGYEELIHDVVPSLPLTDSISDTSVRNTLSYDDIVRLTTLYNALGDMYYSAGNLDKTFKAYENSLFFYPSNPMTLNNYAYFLTENGGDLAKAEEMSKKSIEQSPDNATYLDTYAWILFKKKDYKEALEYQRKALECAKESGDADNAEFYSHLGDILFMNHEPDEALENWKRALELDPDDGLLKKKVTHKTFFYE